MQLTVQEQINQFRSDVKEAFINNLKIRGKLWYLKKEVDPKDLFIDSFHFSNTKEGIEYWWFVSDNQEYFKKYYYHNFTVNEIYTVEHTNEPKTLIL